MPRIAVRVLFAVLFGFAAVSEVFAEVGVRLGFESDFAVTRASVSLLSLDRGWEKRFQPPGGPMTFKVAQRTGLEFGGIAPSFEVFVGNEKGWLATASVSEPIIGMAWFLRKRHLGVTYVNWWDQVIGREATLRRRTPMLCVGLTKSGFGVAYSAYRYRTFVEDFVGVDCVGCENYSESLGEREVARGIAHRIALRILVPEEDGSPGGTLEIFFERQGAKSYRVGFSGRLELLRFPGKKQNSKTGR